jgi:hypothetical protein
MTRTGVSNRLDDGINQRLARFEAAIQDILKTLASIDHRLTALDERSTLVRG